MNPNKKNQLGANGPDIHPWVKEFPAAIVVSDKNGVILSLNEEACRSFQKEGGAKLVGSNMLDCHPEPSRSKLKAMMDGRRKNIYTIQKNGVKKLVFQTPWSLDGEYAGLAEIVFEIPWEMPHFIRDQKKD